MGRRQKGKGGKRRKSWHRGVSEFRRHQRASRRLPETGGGGDPTEGAPAALRRGAGPRNHYDC